MKFTFTSEFVGFGSPKNTMEFEVDQLSDVVTYFEQFLRGCGYHFDGHLDFLTDEELYGTVDGQQTDELYESQEVMSSPSLRTVTSLQEKCNVRGCGLTRQQLGDHVCYDSNCGFKN